MLVMFDIRDDINLPEDALEDLITKSSLFSLCSQWRWFNGAHLDHVIIAVPGPEDDGNTTSTTEGT